MRAAIPARNRSTNNPVMVEFPYACQFEKITSSDQVATLPVSKFNGCVRERSRNRRRPCILYSLLTYRRIRDSQDEMHVASTVNRDLALINEFHLSGEARGILCGTPFCRIREILSGTPFCRIRETSDASVAFSAGTCMLSFPIGTEGFILRLRTDGCRWISTATT